MMMTCCNAIIIANRVFDRVVGRRDGMNNPLVKEGLERSVNGDPVKLIGTCVLDILVRQSVVG